MDQQGQFYYGRPIAARVLRATGVQRFNALVLLSTVGLLMAIVNPERPAFQRLTLLIVLGIVLGLAWRAPWPQLPEMSIPTAMF